MVLTTPTTNAVEELAAAIFVSDEAAIRKYERVLRGERQANRLRIPPSQLVRWLREIAEGLGLDVRRASKMGSGQPGDIELVLDTGEIQYVELKSQTTKRRWSEITQADWVNDETDALRYLVWTDSEFRALLPSAVRRALTLPDPQAYFSTWSFADLWMADILGRCSLAERAVTGMPTPGDMDDLIERKYFLHISQQGARLAHYRDLGPIRDFRAGLEVEYGFKDNPASLVAVQVAIGGTPSHGTTDFTYHVGYGGGKVHRHKLHHYALARSVFSVTATS